MPVILTSEEMYIRNTYDSRVRNKPKRKKNFTDFGRIFCLVVYPQSSTILQYISDRTHGM